MNNNLINFVLGAVTNGKKPEQMIQQMVQQNPQAQILFNQMQQSGMSMRDFTMQYAKQNNIDLQPIIQQLNNSGIKL